MTPWITREGLQIQIKQLPFFADIAGWCGSPNPITRYCCDDTVYFGNYGAFENPPHPFGMVQAWVGQKLVNVTFCEFFFSMSDFINI